MNDKRRIDFLDYLRIFAFVSVLVGHKFAPKLRDLLTAPDVHPVWRAAADLLLPFVRGGGAGVVVFFLVSGYIIVHVLQTERTKEFLLKRAFRIYPLYIVAVLMEHCLLQWRGSAPSGLVLLQQLTLVGDLFGTPYALAGVEWTLRLELVFYLCLALLRAVGVVTGHRHALPLACLALVFACRWWTPIPALEIWSKGYLTIYGPFLLVGVMTYLLQHGRLAPWAYVGFVLLVFASYYDQIALYQPRWVGVHFAMLAYVLFMVAFAVRDRLVTTAVVLWLSDLTYAVYLFHNWMFDALKTWVRFDVAALALLIAWCALMVRCVERPFIRWGRRLARG